MKRRQTTLASLFILLLTFILFVFLYTGPVKGEAGMIILLLAIVLLLKSGIIIAITYLIYRFKKIRWNIIRLGVFDIFLYELLLYLFNDQPMLFSVFGKQEYNASNYEFLFSIVGWLSTIVVLSVFGLVKKRLDEFK